MIRSTIIFAGCLLWFVSCSPISKKALTKKASSTESQLNDHMGFMLYDPAKQKIVFEYNSDRYFTPASNTKIFTLFASLNILGDSIPALRYVQQGDSTIIMATGDPSFLNPNVFDNHRVYEFLNFLPGQLYYSPPGFFTSHFGPGWSWEDYEYSFSSERSPFPVYGNCFEVYNRNNKVETKPRYFQPFVSISADTLYKVNVTRSPFSNMTTYIPGDSGESKWIKPFITDSSMVARLLSDTLHRSVKSISYEPLTVPKTIYSLPSDSLYKVMMQESDNFIAEQLLIMCASVLGDSLTPEIPIEYVTKNFLNDLPDKPVWIDGSGLSRYNLFTPRSIVMLWDKLYKMIPRERLFSIVAIGGKAGTLKNSYNAEQPYIFGKTGTLSNVHCLSGYLVTKKGETLIFSFMNTNFTVPTREIRNRMEQILVLIRDEY